MASQDQFKIGSTYSFTTYSPSLLGNFRNVSIDGVGDYQIARHFIDPAAMHIALYDVLPESTPDDHRKYNYIVMTKTSGEKTALGLPWIDGNSIEQIERQKIEVKLEDVGTEDIERVRKLLLANGYEVASVELIDD